MTTTRQQALAALTRLEDESMNSESDQDATAITECIAVLRAYLHPDA